MKKHHPHMQSDGTTGNKYSDFQLEQGDFLTHPTIDEKIREADVIFVNNYVFGSRVNHDLKVKFMNMKGRIHGRSDDD